LLFVNLLSVEKILLLRYIYTSTHAVKKYFVTMNSVLKSAYKHTRNKFCKQRKNIVNIFLTSSQSKSAGFLIFFKKKVTDAEKKSFPNYCSIAAGVINGE